MKAWKILSASLSVSLFVSVCVCTRACACTHMELYDMSSMYGEGGLSAGLSSTVCRESWQPGIPSGGWPSAILREMIKKSVLTENAKIFGLSILLPIPDNCSFLKAILKGQGVEIHGQKRPQRGFFHKRCKLVLRGPSEKDLLTFSVADIRIITVGRVQKQILFSKRKLELQGEEEGSSYIFPQLMDNCTGNAAQQGKFSD